MEIGKFRELILYIAQQSQKDQGYGRVKLFKLLFFIDQEHYRRFGRTITEQQYCKMEHGPVPENGAMVLDQLEQEGALSTRERQIIQHTQKRAIAERNPDLYVFTEQELDMVDEIIKSYRGMSAREIKRISHKGLGWRLADLGEIIPMGVSLIYERRLNDEELSYATGLASSREFQLSHG